MNILVNVFLMLFCRSFGQICRMELLGLNISIQSSECWLLVFFTSKSHWEVNSRIPVTLSALLMDSSLLPSRESPGFRLSGQLAQMFYYPVNFILGQVPSFSLSQRLPHVTIISSCCCTPKVHSQQLLSFIRLQLCFRFYYSFLLCQGMIHWCWMGNCSPKTDLVSAVWKSHTGTYSAS